MLKDKYDSLTSNEIYHAASDRKQDKKNELAAMTVTIRRLDVKIDKLQGNNKNSVNNTPTSSLKPGKFFDVSKINSPKPTNSGPDKSGGHKPPPKPGEPHKVKTKKGHWIYYCTKCNNWRRHDTSQHDEWEADKKAFNTKHGIEYTPKKKVKFKGTLAETVVQQEALHKDPLDTSSTSEDDSTVETTVPTGSLQLMNGLWLTEDINKELCKECIEEDSCDDKSEQFEVDLVNCYTGIPTQELLEELGDFKETKETSALDQSLVEEESTKSIEGDECTMVLAFLQEFLILSAFCISTYFLSQLLKTHGITVNNYLVKFYFTVLSMLFSTWVLDL